jgi:hypothetical protein
MRWLVLKDNYIINNIEWDGVTPYTYPFPHDFLMNGENNPAGIGDWYESSEDIFYRPLKTPPDFPENS